MGGSRERRENKCRSFKKNLKRQQLLIPTEPFPEFKFAQTDQMEQAEFIVRRSDIDTNAHVNNTKYIEWVLETIPEEVYRTYRMVALEAEGEHELALARTRWHKVTSYEHYYKIKEIYYPLLSY